MSETIPTTGTTRLLLEEVQLSLKIGLTDRERQPGVRSRVLVTVECWMSEARFTGSGIGDCLDYDRVYQDLMALERWPHTDLLETFGEAIARGCFVDPRVEGCRITLRKPDIYPNAAAAGVQLTRRRQDGYAT